MNTRIEMAQKNYEEERQKRIMQEHEEAVIKFLSKAVQFFVDNPSKSETKMKIPYRSNEFLEVLYTIGRKEEWGIYYGRTLFSSRKIKVSCYNMYSYSD